MAGKSDLIVIASAKAQPGREKALEQALRDVAKPTRAQPGSISFGLYRSKEDRSIIVGIERWASASDHDKHLQGTHVQKLMAALADCLAGPPVILSYEVLDEA